MKASSGTKEPNTKISTMLRSAMHHSCDGSRNGEYLLNLNCQEQKSNKIKQIIKEQEKK